MNRKISIAALAFCLSVSCGSACAQISGAIFTTTQSGTTTNGNIYANIADVYLNGGPQNMNSAGLLDGTYYFQVTDPNGSLLLSTDPAICRELNVTAGVVSGATGTCPHANGNFNTANGSTTVQLAPFGPTDNPGGEYKVYLIPIGSATIDTDGLHLLFSDKDAKTDNFKVLCSTTGGCGGQPQQPMISGYKWYDTNTNGVYDSGEPVIPGWRINATDGSTNLMSWTYTGSNGYYTIPADSNNTYTIAEIFPNSTWIATACVGAASQSGGASTICNSNTSASVSTGTTTNILGPNFGNVCTGAGGGLTLGFWSNPNGQRILSSDSGWAAFLDALNLRGATGANFDPSTLSGFKSWLLSATATNMAYMLSAQLATMELNVRENDVSASSLIYAPGTSSANAAGFATVAAIMTEANNELGLHPSTLSGSLYRNYQQSLKNALDQANNNFNFVQAGPASCPFSTPY